MNEFFSRPATKAFFAIAGALLFAWAVYMARVVLFPFVVAFGLAYLLDPLIDRLEKLKMSRSFAIFLAFFFLILLLAVAAMILGPLVWGQVEAFAENIPEYIKYMEKTALPWLMSIPEMDRAKMEELLRQAMGAMGDLPLTIIKGISSGIWSGLSSLMGLLITLFNLVIIPVVTFYLLKDFDRITEKITERIPPGKRERVLSFFRKIDLVLADFMRGQLLVASFMALILSIGLYFIGTPMGLVIGILAGLANIVPYLSIILGLAPALLMTFLQFGDWTHPALVALLFGLAQTFEGFVLTPRVLEKAVGLHPVAVMAALLIGASFFGFIGLLLAVPTAAVIKVALFEMDEAYLKSDFYKIGENKDR